MPFFDVLLVLRFWGALFLIGAAAFPVTKLLFPHWHDRGYLFSKAVGLGVVTWIVYILGLSRFAEFRGETIFAAIACVFIAGVIGTYQSAVRGTPREHRRPLALRIVLYEALFLGALLFWSWIKGHEPSIRGLEKFMDYGFMQSIMNSRYFPPADMWYPPYPINYYYFGHLVTALLTKLSGVELAYTFNMMLAALFAFTLTMSFSIGYQLMESTPVFAAKRRFVPWVGGILTAVLVTLSGNMQTIYAFTKGYTGEEVKPFWQLWWGIGEFFSRYQEGMNTYWYANATRFIPYTIHEFPSYSFVVSDVHGHVLSLPFVLLAIALVLSLFGSGSKDGAKRPLGSLIFYGFLLGVLLMTNALDGPIYGALFVLSLFFVWIARKGKTLPFKGRYFALETMVVIASAGLASMPFLAHFTSFVNGIAVNCPHPWVANTKIGPLLFEGVEKCQRSELWMLWLLWGFFFYVAGAILAAPLLGDKRIKSLKELIRLDKINFLRTRFTQDEQVLIVFILLSTMLLIFPEFFYFKDIYPQHFRSNTMFKLGYQAFIMLSIAAGYGICRFAFAGRAERLLTRQRIARKIFFLLLLPQLMLVLIYPLFSVRSYFGGLARYEGLYGMTWFAGEYPDDYQAALWLTTAMRDREGEILLEADGDSYTDYERFSVFTGRPTPIGWAVHEWLWRGTYDVVAPRREDVKTLYESGDIALTDELIRSYRIAYVVVGTLERQKYKEMNEAKWQMLGTEVFRSNETVIYEVGK
jgi:YYY domain-containing protein